MSSYKVNNKKTRNDKMQEKSFENKKNSKKNVAFLTLGCKVNSYESDAMKKNFEIRGYKIVTIDEKADIVIINTCTVTNMADRKSRQMIHRARKNNPDAIVVATGCYVQAAGDEVLADGTVDIAVGNNKKQDIVSIVEKYIADKSFNMAVIDINKPCGYEKMSIGGTLENTRAYVKIQDGCNQFCSYCIIPYARGRIRSRRIEDILDEVKLLAANGYKEIVITGIHLSSYGLDFEMDDTFAGRDYNPFMFKYLIKVIEDIAAVEGIERIRLGSLEPRIITDEFLSGLSKTDKLCPHFHLSLQSGSDDTLKRMNRKYDTNLYYNSLQLLRKYFDNPAITTDIIAGFVGETQREFEETYAFAEKCNFSMIHVFKYSRRKGTAADRMEGHVREEIKAERSNKLLGLTKRQHIEYMDKFIGSSQKILLEEETQICDKRYFIGHNERYVRVAIPADGTDILCSNDIVDVRIIKRLDEDTLMGNLL